MRIVDLTHISSRKTVANDNTVPVVVRSVDQIHLIPLTRLVTLATVVDLTGRPDAAEISRSDIAGVGVSDIGGCILRTDWCDKYIMGWRSDPPAFSLEAASYLLGAGVRTVACDFPIAAAAADLLLHNNCVLVHCLSNLQDLSKNIVRLIALPLKLEDVFSAEARVIAIEE